MGSPFQRKGMRTPSCFVRNGFRLAPHSPKAGSIRNGNFLQNFESMPGVEASVIQRGSFEISRYAKLIALFKNGLQKRAPHAASLQSGSHPEKKEIPMRFLYWMSFLHMSNSRERSRQIAHSKSSAQSRKQRDFGRHGERPCSRRHPAGNSREILYGIAMALREKDAPQV